MKDTKVWRATTSSRVNLHLKVIRRKLECAASSKSFGRVPRRWLTAKNLLSGRSLDDEGELSTILHLAAQCGSLHLLPKRLLTIENLLRPDTDRKQCCFCLASEAANLQCIPRNLLTPSVVKHSCWQDGETLIHKAATCGQLHLLPKEYLVEEYLLALSDFGETALQLAAKSGSLHQMPRNILTVKNMMNKIRPDGLTSYHLAILSDTLHLIPLKLITVDALLDQDARGGTVLGYATQLGHLSAIPIIPELASRLSDVNHIVRQALFHPIPTVYSRFGRSEVFRLTQKWQEALTRRALRNTAT